MNMINFKCAKKYCCEDLSKIENYEVALNSDKVYDVHHRLEIQENGVYLSSIDLIKQDLYFKRPASELIFLSKSDHASLHANNNNGFLGKNHTEETKQKISKSLYGKKRGPMLEETKQKLSAANKGKHNHKGENSPFYGKEHSEETKQKIRLAHLGKKKVWNDETHTKYHYE